MAAVNLQTMSANIPFDFLHLNHPHSRSNSISSSSTHSPSSRPQSSQGIVPRLPSGMSSSVDDPYRLSSYLGSDHVRHTSAYSLPPTDMSPGQSPPNSNITNPAPKGHIRQSHLRARAAASPYPRDTESVHSSSSETDDLTMFLGGSSDYSTMYGSGHPMPTNHQEPNHTAGAFGRMSLNHDHALQKLAANVRVATTTSASDRAKQIFVQAWLTANYAPYPDGNVPRQGLYFSYRRVCDQYQIPHINTATLGKAIRLCFPTIKTRRLGVRGNSKYHYCGIRPATSAEAEFLQDYIRKSNNNAGQSSINAARAAQESGETNKGEERSDDDDDEDSEGSSASKGNTLVLSGDIKGTVTYGDLSDKTPTAGSLLSQAQAVARNSTYPSHAPIRRHASQPESNIPPQPTLSLGPSTNGQYVQPHQHLSVRHMPHFPSIEEAVGSGSASAQSIAGREAWGWFQDHLDAVLESTRSFRFDQFEMHLRGFWSTLTGAHREIVHAPAIAGLMAKADAIVYDEILEFLRSQMLSPLPAASLNNLRQLASQMEKILLLALDGYGTTFMEPKVELGARFGHLVLRFLDIYQVTQALNTVLTNQKQLAEMRRSWQKVDFESVRNQSALVCNCRHEDLVQLLEVEFVAMMDGLAKSNEPVRDVMAWADKCTERLMEQRIGTSDDRGAMSPRSVLIRWGYVTSQVMRDLTIRSDPAFGAFQIMKLFLDDWIAVNVLRNVALSTNSVAASVEPVIQQQFFSLSPMAGQESFNTIEARPQHAMNHTPTTSSMLAALQHDPFPPGALDASASGFNSDAYGGLNYMDTAVTPEESIPSVHQAGLSFSEYATTNTFDVASFSTQELSLSGNSSEPERELESIKAEAAS